MNSYLLNPTAFDHFFGSQVAKFGAFASDTLAVNFWYLTPGQDTPIKKNGTTDEIYVALNGACSIIMYRDEALEGTYAPSATKTVIPPSKPDMTGVEILAKSSFGAGEAVVAPKNRFHAIRNVGEERTVVLSVSQPIQSGQQVFVSR